MTFIKKFREFDFFGVVLFAILIAIQKLRPDILQNHIRTEAMKIASLKTMSILDAEGISHCALCPRRFGVVKVGKFYLCAAHKNEMVTEKGAA